MLCANLWPVYVCQNYCLCVGEGTVGLCTHAAGSVVTQWRDEARPGSIGTAHENRVWISQSWKHRNSFSLLTMPNSIERPRMCTEVKCRYCSESRVCFSRLRELFAWQLGYGLSGRVRRAAGSQQRPETFLFFMKSEKSLGPMQPPSWWTPWQRE
jgi:hypothetical protein